MSTALNRMPQAPADPSRIEVTDVVPLSSFLTDSLSPLRAVRIVPLEQLARCPPGYTAPRHSLRFTPLAATA